MRWHLHKDMKVKKQQVQVNKFKKLQACDPHRCGSRELTSKLSSRCPTHAVEQITLFTRPLHFYE